MAGFAANFTLTAQQGQDVVSDTAFVSGENKTFIDADTLYSGLSSGQGAYALNLDLTRTVGLQMKSDVDHQQITVYSLSGSLQLTLEANRPLSWYSGGSFTSGHPLGACSGNPIGISQKQLSGFASGSFQMLAIQVA